MNRWKSRSRRLRGAGIFGIVLTCCLAVLLASCGASFRGVDWGRARLACADLGLEPDTGAFDKCVFDLYYTLWDEQNAGER